jgi:hypothetical protein
MPQFPDVGWQAFSPEQRLSCACPNPPQFVSQTPADLDGVSGSGKIGLHDLPESQGL